MELQKNGADHLGLLVQPFWGSHQATFFYNIQDQTLLTLTFEAKVGLNCWFAPPDHWLLPFDIPYSCYHRRSSSNHQPSINDQEDKEYAKFKDKNLDVYQTYYEALFRDTVTVGDKAKLPCKFGNGSTLDDVQFVDITDGKVDTDEVRLFEDVDPFLTYDSSSMKRRGKKLTPRRDNKRKFEGKNEGKSMACLSYEENLDTVFDVLLTRSTQPSRETTQSPITEDCMAIVSTFQGFEEGSVGYLEALEVLLKKPSC
ncbi:unnamed protein product [Lactuca saligna]|uniref:Uncharacterized protein n=1 Tax=Lactuca saligna TaxID=75948 RepID=A0AA35YRU6_LACSI|nr:unnamed protein product [Lactuca saligna]